MLNKKTIKNILLEVEASYYNYEKYLNVIMGRVLNKDDDIKYLIARENEYNECLTLYKYSESEYIQWIYEHYYIYDYDYELLSNYSMMVLAGL